MLLSAAGPRRFCFPAPIRLRWTDFSICFALAMEGKRIQRLRFVLPPQPRQQLLAPWEA